MVFKCKYVTLWNCNVSGTRLPWTHLKGITWFQTFKHSNLRAIEPSTSEGCWASKWLVSEPNSSSDRAFPEDSFLTPETTPDAFHDGFPHGFHWSTAASLGPCICHGTSTQDRDGEVQSLSGDRGILHDGIQSLDQGCSWRLRGFIDGISLNLARFDGSCHIHVKYAYYVSRTSTDYRNDGKIERLMMQNDAEWCIMMPGKSTAIIQSQHVNPAATAGLLWGSVSRELRGIRVEDQICQIGAGEFPVAGGGWM